MICYLLKYIIFSRYFMDNLLKIMSLLKESKSPFHVVSNIKSILLENGFVEMKEEDEIKEDGKYFYSRNGSALIAFAIKRSDTYAKIIEAHVDSPSFKLKQNPIVNNSSLRLLNTEPYGGGIYYSWLDRPLGVAGRALFKKNGVVSSILVDLDASFIIPSLAIHMNRDVNNSFSLDPKKDLLPLIGESGENDLKKVLETQYKEKGEVISFDLFLYSKEEPTLIGLDKSMLSSCKLDDLSSVYSSLLGFIASSMKNGINVVAYFDSEEVGSMTYQGADSDLLRSLFAKFSTYTKKSIISLQRKSFCISADNAHACHPAFIELMDKTSPVYLNKGITIKYNANQKYTSDGFSSAIMKEIFNLSNLSYQEFSNRSDLRGGSTLGDISISQISIRTVDIGIPQLAMHSSYETLGVKDLLDMVKLSACFFDLDLDISEDEFKVTR
ncbi:MAG TPA: M18 family aminopeptidase [Firmicutes bacterium]|nr:M18 family aminopeptidase [Bacillota bacterium]